MAGKHEGLKNEINRGSTEKAQDAILITSSHRQKCLWAGLFNVLKLGFSRPKKSKEICLLS